MIVKYLENLEYFSQRDNKFSPSVACFPTSTAMAMKYKNKDIDTGGLQLEDYIVQQCLNLSDEEKTMLTKQQGAWIWNHRPFQVIPIMAYVCNKISGPVVESWGISYQDIKKNIDNNIPVVCLGNFKSISYVGGHYNCIIGYEEASCKVVVMDPFGDGHSNYKINDGSNIFYDWKLFDKGNGNSYGLYF